MRIWSTRDCSLAFAMVGETMVQVNAPEVSKVAWEEYVDNLTDLFGTTRICELYNYSPTFAPSASQVTGLMRRHSEKLLELKLIALVTSSAAVRKVINAIAWMMPTRVEIRAYHTDRAVRALEWLVLQTQGNLGHVRVALEELMVHTGYSGIAPAVWGDR